MSIKLKTAPFEFEGRTYKLCCNMNVLAEVQESFDGDLPTSMGGKRGIKVLLAFFSAMLNEAADSEGWPERFTGKDLGRRLSAGDMVNIRSVVMPLVISSVGGRDPDDSKAEPAAAEDKTDEAGGTDGDRPTQTRSQAAE